MIFFSMVLRFVPHQGHGQANGSLLPSPIAAVGTPINAAPRQPQEAPRLNTTPVGRPLLPDRQRLEPYLDAIDGSRVYGNYGPLSLRFEQRLAERFGLPHEGIIAVANGTI